MGYTKMNRHNYPDIEGLTEAERAKLDHIDDIEDDLADAYDSTATYAVGDWCIRNGKLYECITAIATAEPFDSTKWRRVAVAELKSNLTDLGGDGYSTAGLSYPSNVSYVDGGYCKIGKLVVVNIRLSITGSNVQVGTAVVANLPAPNITTNNNCVAITNNKKLDMSMTSTGSITCVEVVTTGTLICSFTYVCK